MSPKRRSGKSGRYQIGARTRANGYTGKSGWPTATKKEIHEKIMKEAGWMSDFRVARTRGNRNHLNHGMEPCVLECLVSQTRRADARNSGSFG